jgi:hypothetical protein
VHTGDGVIRFALLDNVGVHRTIHVKFGSIPDRTCSVFVNDRVLGQFTPGELERGIDVSL